MSSGHPKKDWVKKTLRSDDNILNIDVKKGAIGQELEKCENVSSLTENQNHVIRRRVKWSGLYHNLGPPSKFI